jgi:excisionase family DNA binding protein
MRCVGEDRDKAQARTQDRVTIQEAARRLGVKEDAIRKRIQRGTLRHKKSPEGRVYVWIDSAQDASQDKSPAAYQDACSELVEELRDRVSYLERELEEERGARIEERRRHDTFMAELMRRIPAIGAPRSEGSSPSEPRESPEGSGPGHVQ